MRTTAPLGLLTVLACVAAALIGPGGASADSTYNPPPNWSGASGMTQNWQKSRDAAFLIDGAQRPPGGGGPDLLAGHWDDWDRDMTTAGRWPGLVKFMGSATMAVSAASLGVLIGTQFDKHVLNINLDGTSTLVTNASVTGAAYWVKTNTGNVGNCIAAGYPSTTTGCDLWMLWAPTTSGAALLQYRASSIASGFASTQDSNYAAVAAAPNAGTMICNHASTSTCSDDNAGHFYFERVLTEPQVRDHLHLTGAHEYVPGEPIDRDATAVPIQGPFGGPPSTFPDWTSFWTNLPGWLKAWMDSVIKATPGATQPPTASPDWNMPDCTGLTESACVDAVENVDNTTTITFTEQDATFQGADVTLPPNTVTTTQPAKGARVTTSSVTITLTLNPDPVPMLVPEPLAHETYADWLARARQLGYLGDATATELSTDTLDTTHGPDEAVRTSPSGGTRIPPDQPIVVYVNPPDAPPGGGGGGGDCSCPPIDLGPLTALHPSSKFPFGAFGYLGTVLGWFDVTPVPPGFDIAVSAQVGNSGALPHYAGTLAAFNPYMAVLRGLMSLALWVGAIWLLATKLLGFGAGGDLIEAADDGSVL